MATFDAQLDKVAAYVEEMQANGTPVRTFACPSTVEDLARALPIRVGPGANPRIILRSDTFVELGDPSAGSCAFILWANTPARLHDGRITLIGPDIPEVPGASLPFGQIVLVGGAGLGPEAHQPLAQSQYVADQIEGYMVRSSSRNIWSRVSKDAAAKGFCFETLGRALMMLCKSNVPKIEAMETIFVTSGKDDVLRLDAIAGQVREIGKEIVKAHWKARGFDLDCDLDCRSCHDKQTCDVIREVVAHTRKARKARAARAARRVA